MENKGTGNSNKKKSALPVWALIFAFIFPPAGFILSIVSLAMKKRKTGMSITALVLSVLNAIIVLIVIALLIILSPSIFIYSLFLPLFALTKAVDSSYSEADATKELTNYFSDSPIVSARYYYYDDDSREYKIEEIPEDKLDLFVDTLNSLTISGSSSFNGDYYYGWRKYIQCTLEDGSKISYDGEELEYYNSNSESSSHRFVFVKEDFWGKMDSFNKTIRNEDITEIAVYGFLDSSDARDYIYETQDGIYITLNNKLYYYSDGYQELIFECDENLGPVINVSDEYILFIQRSNKFEKIKKYDLNSGDILEECYYEINKYKEAFLDEADEYYFAYNDDEVLCLNISKDEVDYVRNYTASYDGTIKGAIKNLPEGYYAKEYSYYGKRLEFYKETEAGEEILTFHGRNGQELSIVKGDSYSESAISEDTRYTINSIRSKFLSEWEKDTVSTNKGDGDIFSHWDEETFYEEETNRIIGYNPDNNIVYLYSMENNSILMKNIEDNSETVLEVLDEADKIEFEWEESKLYRRYTNDEVETYGGFYDFAE